MNQFHDKSEQNWDEWTLLYDGSKLRMPDENIIRLISGRYITFPKPPTKILDHGFGSANTLIWLVEKGYECYGCEISQELINEALERLSERRLSVDLRKVSGDSLPFENNFFDVIISWNVIHYCGNRQHAEILVREFYRILKPNGILLLSTVHNQNSIVNRAKHIGRDIYEIVQDSQYDNRKGLRIYIPDDGGLLTLFNSFSNVQIGSTHFHLFKEDKQHWARLIYAQKK